MVNAKYHCPDCGSGLIEADVEFSSSAKMSPMRFLKFRVAPSLLMSSAECGELHGLSKREGSAAVYFVMESKQNPDDISGDRIAVKVPGLESTEIWLLEAGQQPAIDRAAGFETRSQSLLVLKSRQLAALLGHTGRPRSGVLLGAHCRRCYGPIGESA